MRHPKIICNQSVLRGFRKRALAAHPEKEHMESIWGKVEGHTIKIYSIHPFDDEKTQECSVIIPAKHVEQDHEDAAEAGLTVLGDIHTHPCGPEEGAAPSECDWADSVEHDGLIMGICGIRQHKKRRSTRIRFYLCQKPLKVKTP